MKECLLCKKEKFEDEFISGRNICKICYPDYHNEKSHLHYMNNKEAKKDWRTLYNSKNRKRQYSYVQVSRAIKKGLLKKNNECEICKTTSNIIAHHQDYNKPLNVNWICKKCHKQIHNAVETVMQLTTA